GRRAARVLAGGAPPAGRPLRVRNGPLPGHALLSQLRPGGLGEPRRGLRLVRLGSRRRNALLPGLRRRRSGLGGVGVTQTPIRPAPPLEGCPRCGADLTPGQEYCLECGLRVPGSEGGVVPRMAAAWQRRLPWYP